jgi:hypothetical protein
MKKLKLYGLGNEETYNHFVIQKKQSFVKLFRDFLINLDIEIDRKHDVRYTLIKSEKNGQITDLKLNKVSDHYEHYGTKRYNIDIFIGKRIVLIVYCSVKDRKKVINNLMKFCEMVKSKKKWRK